ncbi:helix-turn-helix domain-containing protein [Bradyrhizobium japonicum]|uniref:helix-turn-helix domain-containing protein n=1 Tax=Bradyrhizobium japonicum TaxID=375 RepID=UPI000462C08B|nr:helix-turn-helix domain-containing protein [Bradyrhizobium japonicum]
MEESQQFKTYQEGLRAKNMHSCNALLSRLVQFHGDEFRTVSPVVVLEAPPEPAPPAPSMAIAEIVTEIEEGPRKPTIREIGKCVAKRFNISMNELESSRRLAQLVRARQTCFYLARKLTSRSLPEIGRRLGGRDHTTVLFGIRKMERLIDSDKEVARTISELEEQFR